MSKSDDLKQTARLRKAIMPLIDLLKHDADSRLTERLAALEKMVAEIGKHKPEVTVNFDMDAVIDHMKKQTDTIMRKSDPKIVIQPSTYEPHDQAKAAPYNYAGFVRSDGSWYIQRVAKGEQRYAKGTGNYTEAWEKRNKLKYGYLDA